MVEESGSRQDGRATTEVRPIDITMKPLPSQVHGSVLFRYPTVTWPLHDRCMTVTQVNGSVLFTRGETQSLATATLGDSSMAQRYEACAVPCPSIPMPLSDPLSP